MASMVLSNKLYKGEQVYYGILAITLLEKGRTVSKKEQKKTKFPTEEELRDSNAKAIKLICNQHGISASGNRDTIINRLLKHFSDEEKKEDKKKGSKHSEPKVHRSPESPGSKDDPGRNRDAKGASVSKLPGKKKDDDKKGSKKKDDAGKKESTDENQKGSRGTKVSRDTFSEKKKEEKAPVEEERSEGAHPYTCSLCQSKLTGEEEECPGCGTVFGESVAALIDSDWDFHSDIPTPDEIKKMKKKGLKEVCQVLGFENEMSVDEMRSLLLELIEDEEEDNVVEIVGQDRESFDPKRALEETNYIRDNLHKYTEALHLYDRIIEWELMHNRLGELEEALLQKGICLQYMNEFSKARECYILAQEVNPKNPEIKALLMGVNALDKFYENPEQKNALEPDETSLKDRILRILDMDGSQTKMVVDEKYSPGFEETADKKVEVALKPEPEPQEGEPDYSLPDEEAKPRKDDVILEGMDEMSERLDKLKKLKDSIDIKDIEMKSSGGAGIVIVNKVAKATRIEEPEAPEVPEPKEMVAEIVEETKGGAEKEEEEEDEEEVAEAEPEVITPEVMDEGGVVEGELIEEGKIVEDGEVEAEIVAPEVEAEIEETPEIKIEGSPKAPKRKEGPFQTGNDSLNTVINGGFPSSSNILISAPPFMGSEMILFEFIHHNLEDDLPSIIITTGDPIMVIRTRMNQIMPEFEKYEEKEMVGWIDPRSDSLKEKFDSKKGKGPEDHSLILTAIDDFSERFLNEHGGFTLAFVSLTPAISYRDPKEIKDFLGNLTTRVKDQGQVGVYNIDSDMHDETEIKILEDSVSGIIDIKENQNARSKKDKSLIMIRKMPHSSQSRWLPYLADETSYKIG